MLRREIMKSLAVGAGVAAMASCQSVAAPQRSAAAPRRNPWAEASDGTRLFVQDWGAGPPIVFCAPWALNSAWWEQQSDFFPANAHRFIAYDRRGHGRSDWPSGGYDFDTLADDLAAVLEQHDVRDATLVGHSMGCAEVVRYMTRHRGARIKRVALIATITPFILKTTDNPTGIDGAILEKSREAFRKDRVGQIAAGAAGFFGTKNTVSPEVTAWWTRMMGDHCSLKVMADLNKTFTETDFRPELPGIKAPVLLIHGDADVSTPLDFTGRRTQALIPGSELKVYTGAAHALPFTHRDQLNADLLAYARG